jgi:long-chain fatty acid transport protein
VFALAGFGVDYAGSTTNPLLTAPAPNGVGVGPVFSEFQVLQIHPAVAYQVTDRLAVAAGPTLDLAVLKVNPFLATAPDNANGDAFFTYPQGNHSETTWGGGFVGGVYYQADTWAAGASVKSPQWFDNFRYNSSDELGRPRSFAFHLELPMTVSVGAAYTGLEGWVFALDVRYLDFASTKGLGEAGFAPDGAVRGVGWKSVFAVATGAQYRLTEAVSLRAGYGWHENPIPDGQAFINAVAPVILEHEIWVGASWRVTEDFALSVTYGHGFQNAIEGPLVTPTGAVPGTSVRNTTSADAVLLGASVKFGCPTKCRSAPVQGEL